MFEKYDILLNFQEKGIEEVNERVSSALKSINDNIGITSNRFVGLTDNIVKLNTELDCLLKPREIIINTQSLNKAMGKVVHLESKIANLNSTRIDIASTNYKPEELSSASEDQGKEQHFSDLIKGKKIINDSKSISKLLGEGMKANVAGYLITETVNQGLQLYGESVDALRADEKQQGKLNGILHNLTKAKQINEQLAQLTTSNPIGEYASKSAFTLLNNGTSDAKIIQQLSEIGIVGAGDSDKMGLLTKARAEANRTHFLSSDGYRKLLDGGLDVAAVVSDNWNQLGFKMAPGSEQLNSLASGGHISVEMLDKIFQLASGEGSFYRARATEAGETTDAKFTLFNNHKASIKRNIGKATKPITDMFLDGINDFFKLVEPTFSVTEQLTNERDDINHLLQDASGIKQGSTSRSRIIADLKAKYPGQFEGLNAFTDNKLIENTRAAINQSYDSQIAINKEQLDLKKTKDEDAVYSDLADRLEIQASILSRKSHTIADVKKWIKPDDGALVRKSGIAVHFLKTPEGLKEEAASLRNLHLKRQNDISSQENYIKNLQFWAEVDAFKGNVELQKRTWGSNYPRNKMLFEGELNKAAGWQHLLSGKMAGYNYNELEKMVHPSFSPTENSSGNRSMVQAAGHSGQRSDEGGKNAVVINVNSPLIGKQEYRVGSMQQANEISLRQQEEQLLKILRAAANSAY